MSQCIRCSPFLPETTTPPGPEGFSTAQSSHADRIIHSNNSRNIPHAVHEAGNELRLAGYEVCILRTRQRLPLHIVAWNGDEILLVSVIRAQTGRSIHEIRRAHATEVNILAGLSLPLFLRMQLWIFQGRQLTRFTVHRGGLMRAEE